MKSVSSFCSPNGINLWLKQTCITLDFDTNVCFLPAATYISQFILCQLKNEVISTPRNSEIGVVFLLRDIPGIIDCIANLNPMDTLNRVAIILPESHSLILLNGIELDNPHAQKKLKNLTLFPSLIATTLIGSEQFSPPARMLDWCSLWSLIRSKTNTAARKMFCAAYATSAGR